MVPVASSGRPASYGSLQSKDQEFALPVPDSDTDVKQERCLAAWFTLPYFRWYPRWYFTTVRGAEWFHVYLWLAKDLAWTQDWNYIGITSGFAAVFWSIFLLFQVKTARDFMLNAVPCIVLADQRYRHSG